MTYSAEIFVCTRLLHDPILMEDISIERHWSRMRQPVVHRWNKWPDKAASEYQSTPLMSLRSRNVTET